MIMIIIVFTAHFLFLFFLLIAIYHFKFDFIVESNKFLNGSHIFLADGLKVQVRTKNREVTTLKFTRDMFGQILFASQIQKISLRHIIAHPITPAPLSIAHIDGVMCTTDKSKLSERLEKHAAVVDELIVQVVLIDFMFFLRSNAAHLPMKNSDLAQKLILLAKQRYRAREIGFLCDVYSETGPGIKDMCRQDRGITSETVVFPKFGHGQKRPADFLTALKCKKYVVALLEFLKDEFASERCQDVIAGITLHLAYGPCHTYNVSCQIDSCDISIHYLVVKINHCR